MVLAGPRAAARGAHGRAAVAPRARLTVLGRIAAWPNPALFIALAVAVFAGGALAPLFALLVVLCPLLVLVGQRPGSGRPEPGVVAALATVLSVGAVLAANVLAVVAAAQVAEAPVERVLAVTVAAAWVAGFFHQAERVRSIALVVGVSGLGAIVVAMGLAVALTPWGAWEQLASRPALTFSPRSGWVREGRVVLRPTVLTFTEGHRVTAMSPGVFRVEEEAGTATPREVRLGTAESVVLHAGDRLTIPAGARIRFEAGKRIPGAPLSGVAWAESRGSRWPMLIETLGLAVTLLGGAATLVGGSTRAARLAAIATPLLLLAFVLAASSWGVYAAWFAADLGLGAPLIVPLVEAPLALLGRESGWLLATGAVGLGGLLVATAAGLRSRVDRLAQRWPAGHGRILSHGLWLGLLAACVGLSLREAAAEPLLLWGLGLGASAAAAPGLGRGRRTMAAGSVVGAFLFVSLSAAATLVSPGIAALGSYPALLAAPAAAAVAALGGRPRRRAALGRRPGVSAPRLPGEGDADTMNGRHG